MDDLSLVPRKMEGSMITDEEIAIQRCVKMIKEGKVTSINGKELDIKGDTLCVHSMEVVEYILEHAKVAMVPGSAFGSEGEGYLRLSYACSYEDLQEACKRIKEAVEELKK